MNDVAVAGNGDVYTTGCECWKTSSPYQSVLTDSCYLLLWKNDVKQQLSKSPMNFYSSSFIAFNSAGDQYIAGSEPGPAPDFRYIIKLWKNGVVSNVTNGSNDAKATCMYVSGNDVYIGGGVKSNAAYGPTAAVLWKNGTAQTLTSNFNYTSVVAVHGSGSDVYVAIEQRGDSAWILKNAVRYAFPVQLRTISDIFADGSDLYVLGGTSVYARTVWKNGTRLFDLAAAAGIGSVEGRSLYVKGSDVYVSGSGDRAAGETGFVWKNGAVLQTLAEGAVVSVDGLIVK